MVYTYIYNICYPPQKKLPFSLLFLPPPIPTLKQFWAEDMLSYLFVRDAERNIGKMGRNKFSKHLI